MGVNDVGEQLEAAIDDVIRLEREVEELRQVKDDRATLADALAIALGERDRARTVAVHLEQAVAVVTERIDHLRGKFGKWTGMYDIQGHPLMSVAGFCPQGCGETLETYERGIRCTAAKCPDPFSVSAILADSETEHLVTVDEQGWTIKHPLRERLDGEIFDCLVTERARSYAMEELPAGVYRVVIDGDLVTDTLWTRIDVAATGDSGS